MICDPCKIAGQLNQQSLTRDGMTGAMLAESARNGHLGCRGGTWCDCQHKVGVYTRVVY